jgi:hypothetical protein
MSNEEETFNEFYSAAEKKAAIDTVKRDIEVCSLHIARLEAFKRLEQNQDFKSIISEGYVEDLRNGTVKTLGRNLKPEMKADLVGVLSGIGNFQIYLEGIYTLGEAAKVNIGKCKDDLVKLESLTN